MVLTDRVKKPTLKFGPGALVGPDQEAVDRLWRSRPFQRTRRAYEAGDVEAFHTSVEALGDQARVLVWCMGAQGRNVQHLGDMLQRRTSMLIVEAVQRLRKK